MMTVACFVSGAALFAAGVYLSYVNIAPQQALVLLFLLLVCISLMLTSSLNKLELKLGMISSKKD